jgi:hypothetical protein
MAANFMVVGEVDPWYPPKIRNYLHIIKLRKERVIELRTTANLTPIISVNNGD